MRGIENNIRHDEPKRTSRRGIAHRQARSPRGIAAPSPTALGQADRGVDRQPRLARRVSLLSDSVGQDRAEYRLDR